MGFIMHKPAWFAKVWGIPAFSPATVLEVADWWDAWRLMWMAIGAALDGSAQLWRRLDS
jgi:hypothetical protein